MEKNIIITGASRGIGLATAKKFVEAGWQVIGTYNNHPIPFKAENLLAVKLDLAAEKSIGALVETVKEHTGGIQVLVNNAGVVLDYDEDSLNLDKTRKTFEVDLFAVMDFTEKLLPFMGKGGHIINVGSGYGSFSDPINDKFHSAYRMAKAALHMYSRTLAFRLKDEGIIVSTLDPGWVRTDMGLLGVKENDEEQPDREPADAAEDIYRLVEKAPETGGFWKFGGKREW